MATRSPLLMKANRGIKDKVGWSTELARLRVARAPVPVAIEEGAVNDGPLLSDVDWIAVLVDLAFGGISDFTSGGCGTGLVGFGGMAEDRPDVATDSPTCTDDDDDECAVPAGVVPEGIGIAAFSRAT